MSDLWVNIYKQFRIGGNLNGNEIPPSAIKEVALSAYDEQYSYYPETGG